MTAHTTRHRYLHRTIHLLNLFDRPVAISTGAASLQVPAVTEHHITGNFIDSSPFELAFLTGISRQGLNRRTRGLYIGMTLHAHRRCRESHHFARVWVFVTDRAFQ